MTSNLIIFYGTLIVLSGLTVFLIALGLFLAIFGKISKNWMPVPAVIVSSQVIEGRNGRGMRGYFVKVKYNYLLDTNREGTWIAFALPGTRSNWTPDKNVATKLHAQIPVGTTMTAYAFPKFPSIAVLMPGFNQAAIGYILLSSIFAIVPLLVAWVFLRG